MTRIAIVGVGKIARDQHIPHIKSNPAFEYVAAVTRGSTDGDGVPAFNSIADMMKAGLRVEAVAVCTPPIGRLDILRDAFAAGLDVLLEKPPAATLSEAELFGDMAATAGRLLYMTWHLRQAPAVEPARKWLDGKSIKSVHVNWLEDVRVWHPGQEWVWQPGIGVFDPGINALSAITRILPWPLRVVSSALKFPANKQAPIAAFLKLAGPTDADVAVELNWDQRGEQSWEIRIETDGGTLDLTRGASAMTVDGATVDVGHEEEYASMYRHFAKLLAARRSDVDLSPFRLVADAYMLGQREQVAAFDEHAPVPA